MGKYKIFYKLTHADGTLVDSSGSSPFEFEIGDGQLDPCLESCVKEAKVGELRTFLLSADDGFGEVNPAAIQVMKRQDFPANMALKLSAGIEFKTPTDESFAGCIDKIDGDNISVNFNHPLAGCGVSFQVEIIEIL
ncbi:MAG: peptidylprolyl isomerase [Candidatus Thioglobus sp.]|nr:MAG: peptidylprolyl isomerase [Candidatus Thioglobus sp.]